MKLPKLGTETECVKSIEMTYSEDLCNKEQSKTHTSIWYRHSTQIVSGFGRCEALSWYMSYQAAEQQWSPKWFFLVHLKPYTLLKQFAMCKVENETLHKTHL